MERLAFGRFVFDLSSELLFEGGEPVGLGSRAARLLATLLRRRGEVLTKGQLIEAAWPRRTVEEANLSVQMSQLRRRLGKAPDGRDWIATVPRTGYRFAQPADVQPVVGSADRRPTLAVLPFSDLSPGSVEDHQARAVVEDLTVALSRLPTISVLSRKSGGADSASYLVEGSIRRTSGRTRTSAHLIDGHDGTHLWSQHFDRDTAPEGDQPDDLAETVAATLEPQIRAVEIARSRRERPQSKASYDLYMRALHHMRASRPDEHAAAYALITDALRVEPENVSFLAVACEILHHGISVGWPATGPADIQETVELANRGLRHAGDDGVSLSFFGMALLTTRDFDLGRAIVQRASDLEGRNSFVLVGSGLSALWEGHLDEAERSFTNALKFGPADPALKFALGGLGAVHRRRENFEESLRWARLAFSVNPNYAGTLWTLIASNAILGRKDDAARYLRHYQRVAPGVTVASIAAGQPIEDPAILNVLLDGLRLGGLPEGNAR